MYISPKRKSCLHQLSHLAKVDELSPPRSLQPKQPFQPHLSTASACKCLQGLSTTRVITSGQCGQVPNDPKPQASTGDGNLIVVPRLV